MEQRLQKLVDNLAAISNVQDMDINNSVAVRLTNSISAKITVIVCGVTEPVNMVLPLNVSWLNLDPSSQFYKKVLIRTSKETSSQFANTWKEAHYYNDVVADQYYDDADKAFLQESANIGLASVDVIGTVKLSVAPADASNPIAVGEGDPRLTDARTPLSHTHPIQPAESIKTATNIVTIVGSAAPTAGQVLMATSPTTAEWKSLTAADIK